MTCWRATALRLVALCGAAGLAFAAQPAFATDTTGGLSVNATITSNCAVSTTTVAFGNIDVTLNTAVDATGGMSVTCTNGTAWTAKADAGTGGAGTSLTHRKMTGPDKLSYDLFTDSTRTTKWGDGVTSGTATITGTGTGSAQASTIYGRVRAGSTARAGSYSDTVTVTVTY